MRAERIKEKTWDGVDVILKLLLEREKEKMKEKSRSVNNHVMLELSNGNDRKEFTTELHVEKEYHLIKRRVNFESFGYGITSKEISWIS